MRTPHMPWLGRAALVASLVACSSLKVNTDADPQADLTSYRSFAFVRPDMSQQPAGVQQMDDLMRRRVESAITNELTKKGLQPAGEGAEPDLYIAIHAGKQDKMDVYSTPGYSYGHWGGGYVYGGGTTVSQYTEGTLAVDLYDGKKKELVWRGVASDVVNDRDQAAKKVPGVVQKMFEKFPGKKA